MQTIPVKNQNGEIGTGQQIWLYQGDCLEIMEGIPDKTVDLVLCDLPYGQTARTKWDDVIPFASLWEQYERMIKDNGAILLFGNGKFTIDLIMSNRKLWRYNLIWEKTTVTGFLNANRMPMRCHEDICVFYKKLPTYNPVKSEGHKRKVSLAEHRGKCREGEVYDTYTCDFKSYDSTSRFPRSVLKFPTDKQRQQLHPTQKPLALCEYLIKLYSNEGDTVLDNCMGSGTTGVAAKSIGRKFIGIEKEEAYFEIAERRIAEFEVKQSK